MDAVIVTGAAGALGHAVVAEFRAAGRPVVALDLPGGRLDALGAQDGVHAVPVDLASRAAVHAAFAEVDALSVAPDALVALAGGFVPGALADVDEEQLDGLWRSNFGSALWTAQAVAPRLAARGGGAIVTVGARTAVSGAAPVAHATSKAAVVRLTALLADAATGDALAVKRRLSEPAAITRGLEARLSVSELVEELTECRVQKVIAAGRYVLAGVRRDGYRGVVIAELAPGGRGVSGLRLFAE